MYKATTHLWQSKGPFFKLTVLGSALVALGMSGCSSAPSTSNVKTQQTQMLGATGMDGLEDLLSATDMRAVEGDRLLVLKHGDVWKRMLVGFKMDLNQSDPRISAQRGWFISRQPYIDRLSARASRYLYHTVKEAERRGLPTELALLPIIESSYDPAATSSAAAAGLWQFIPSTGKIYGLKQTSQYDGRRDVVESTRAAYEFLGSLYNQFGSWELALASYNAGPGRIQQAINRNKAAGLPTDYWSLKLPQETMYYVPRFIAVAQIIKNPSAYNVTLPAIANRPHFREIQVGTVALNEIAQITGLSRAELYQLNPGHRGEYVDASSPMRILIPADLSPAIDARLKTLNQGSLFANAPLSSPDGSFKAVTPVKTTPPPIVNTKPTTTVTAAAQPKPSTPTSTAASNAARRITPQGSAALAAFASNTDIPSAPRIPVAVTPAANVQPVRTEPAISTTEREQILAAVRAEGRNKTVDEVLKPVASQAEQAKVVAELKQIAPQGTEIVDPVDGKIKLTALQTSQSIAEQSGKEVTKGFAYPKGVADNTSPSSEEAKLNQGKNVIRTGADVVVVPPKGTRSTYVVMPGDNLQMIAMKHGLNWRDVAKWNQIADNAVLYVGTTIYLYNAKPIASAVDSTKPKTVPATYTVRANDSLTGIANEYGLTLKQIADYNNLTVTSGIYTGQKLQLKPNTQSKPKPEIQKATDSKTVTTKTKLYTVQRGEYLGVLADRYGLSNQDFADLTSGLTAQSSLMVGQKINVPANEPAQKVKEDKAPVKESLKETKFEPSYKLESYTVQRGESLYSIANQAKISVTELAELNSLSNRNLQVGQTLKVPAGYTVPENYTVQAGDTLTGIASRYNLTVDYLANVNGISRSSGLRAGQRLALTGDVPAKLEAAKATPANKAASNVKTPDVYIVQAGDTLTSIAAKYYLQISYLMQLNNLKSSNVRIGQQLKLDGEVETKNTAKVETKSEKTAIPTVNKTAIKNANTETHTVKSGESLYAIANRLGMSVSELASLNNLTSNASLRVGQTINIPKKFSDYRVKSGDTLIGVAGRYGLEQSALAELNNLTPNAQLRIGQVIQVPNL